MVLENKEGVFKGGESGLVVVPGKPGESELYRRIALSPDDDEVMPKKGKGLRKNEITLIKLWIQNGAHWSDQALKVFPEAELALEKPDLPESDETNPVDKLIGAYFEARSVLNWSPRLSKTRIFIRRAYLDIVGLLPEPDAISGFQK